MQPSIHQKQVIDWLQADSNFSDAVVNSVAGLGKSTLLKLAADAISASNVNIRDCLVLVFNKKNKTALAGLKQNSSPNKATTLFISCKYVPILLEPFDKTIRYSCTKCL